MVRVEMLHRHITDDFIDRSQRVPVSLLGAGRPVVRRHGVLDELSRHDTEGQVTVGFPGCLLRLFLILRVVTLPGTSFGCLRCSAGVYQAHMILGQWHAGLGDVVAAERVHILFFIDPVAQEPRL
jgi:hypothetical protein